MDDCDKLEAFSVVALPIIISLAFLHNPKTVPLEVIAVITTIVFGFSSNILLNLQSDHTEQNINELKSKIFNGIGYIILLSTFSLTLAIISYSEIYQVIEIQVFGYNAVGLSIQTLLIWCSTSLIFALTVVCKKTLFLKNYE